MPSAHTALRSAIHDALVADTALSAALGGSHVYDEPPRNAAFPYVTLGEARIVDASADGGPTQEHQLTLHAWSRQGGVARSYTTLTTAWAQVTPLAARGGGADVEAGAEGATARYRILLRSNFSLTLQHRLVDGARIFRIAGIRDADDRRFIAVDAELRVE